jgi:hypothetical protein
MGDKKASHYTKTELGRMKNVLWWLVPAIQGYSAYLYSRRTSSFPQSSSGAAFVQTYFFGRFNGIQWSVFPSGLFRTVGDQKVLFSANYFFIDQKMQTDQIMQANTSMTQAKANLHQD